MTKTYFYDQSELRIQSGILPWEYPLDRDRGFFAIKSNGEFTSNTYVSSVSADFSPLPYNPIGSVVQ